MSFAMLKYNASVLAEVAAHYDRLVKSNASEEQLKILKNQVLFLLTAIKKEVEQEKCQL